MSKQYSINRPESLVSDAIRAGIKVPANICDYDQAEYRHWYLFTLLQIERPLPNEGAAQRNAAEIMAIPAELLADVEKAVEHVREKLL